MTRSTRRVRYQPARRFPSWTSHGHTTPGGAGTSTPRSITTSAGATASSPGRGVARSDAVTSVDANISEVGDALGDQDGRAGQQHLVVGGPGDLQGAARHVHRVRRAAIGSVGD